VGDRLHVLSHFDEDEKNTEKKTVLLLHVGGGSAGHGIHSHVATGVSIRYLADPKRETIQTVELTRNGKVDRFEAQPDDKGPKPDTSKMVWRTMDCVDCHNRPTHQYRSAVYEVDTALSDGRIDRSLPFVRREALKAITATYASRSAAESGIRAVLEGFYEKQAPTVWAAKKDAVLAAAAALAESWGRNVWPNMNITWGTYPSFLGHQETTGCWRCHDEKHVDSAGKSITQDCDNCHAVLADGETSPAILKELGQEK
jgi:hypothetical protein